MEFLVKAELIVAVEGRYRIGPRQLQLDRNSPYVKPRHLSWRLRAVDQMDLLRSQDYYYTGAMALSKKSQKIFREEFLNLVERLSNTVVQEEAETLVYLNIDFFEF